MRMSALLCGVRRASSPLRAELFWAAGLISLVLSLSSLFRCLLEHIIILFSLRDSAQCFVSWLAHTFGMSYRCPMELRHLRYFVAVAAHGSFNRAAEILHLTQPALSRQVKDLEEELDVPLLVRGQNTAKLTEAGELFYEEAREVIARADEAVQQAEEHTSELQSLTNLVCRLLLEKKKKKKKQTHTVVYNRCYNRMLNRVRGSASSISKSVRRAIAHGSHHECAILTNICHEAPAP